MSRFFSNKFSSLVPYTPGEQPKDMQYLKLNTNESPYPPSSRVVDAVKREAALLRLYSDPECTSIVKSLADLYGVDQSCVIATNGSDEALNFAFMAFADESAPLAFPDITYGFYTVFADVNGIPYQEIPLKEDFSIDYRDYLGKGRTTVIANPNAPTGIAMPLWQIEEIAKRDPDRVVIVDEAYVDFGGESAIELTKKYDNLLVVQTFSKSRSMAGARLGFAIGNEKLIADLNTIRFSTNPYNVNRMTMAAGVAAIEDNDYYADNCRSIIKNREYTAKELARLGFDVLPSSANFVFARTKQLSGEELYLALKAKGILVRHWSKRHISEYNRITIGTLEQMKRFVSAVEEILKENEK